MLPLARVAVVKDQAPEPLALVVPSEVLPLRRVTVLLASAVPAITNTLSLVLPPLATVPVIGATSSVIVLIKGALGTAVSTVRVTVLLASAPSMLVLPATSKKVLEATEMTPLALELAVGVKVAV